MKRFENILKSIGPMPLVMSVVALGLIIVSGLSYDGQVASHSFWSAIVAVFTRAILGASSWFGNNYGMGIILFTIFI
ncbi:MAG: hypothetical protein L0H66_02995, partial [Loigolactobacillus coryniformis]|nr:hypothetical protein [Loigolactobacillus coryniformis]